MRRIGSANRAAPHRIVGIAQQAEPGRTDRLHRLIVEIIGQFIPAHPKQGEIVGGQPIQKCHGFGSAVRCHRRWVALQITRRPAQGIEHRRPVADGGIDIGQHMFKRANQFAARLGGGALNLDIDH